MADKEQAVLEAIKEWGKPVRPGEIAALTGQDPKEVARLIDALKKKGKATSPNRCFYVPSE